MVAMICVRRFSIKNRKIKFIVTVIKFIFRLSKNLPTQIIAIIYFFWKITLLNPTFSLTSKRFIDLKFLWAFACQFPMRRRDTKIEAEVRSAVRHRPSQLDAKMIKFINEWIIELIKPLIHHFRNLSIRAWITHCIDGQIDWSNIQQIH